MNQKMRLALLVILGLAVTACQGRRFEPANSVSKFRVLGVQASPPEVRPNQATTLSALVVNPDGGPVSYRWEWCPFATTGTNYFECPVTQEELQEQIEASLPEDVPANLFRLPDFDLGTEPTAQLPYPIAQPLLLGLCQAIAQAAAEAGEDSEFAAAIPQLSCAEGYEISVRLVATLGDEPATDEQLENLRDQDQSELIVTGKRVTLWLDSENEQDINPIIERIQIRPKYEDDKELLLDAGHDWVEAIEDFEDDWHTIDPSDDPPGILVGVSYDIRSLVDPDSLQFYSKLAPSGDESGERYQDPESEVLVFNWFTTAGSLGNAQALFVEGRNTLNDAGQADLRIPTTDTSQEANGSNGERFIDSCPELDDSDTGNGCEVRIWSVVRDDRRGQGWFEAPLLATGVTEDGTTADEDDVDVDVN